MTLHQVFLSANTHTRYVRVRQGYASDRRNSLPENGLTLERLRTLVTKQRWYVILDIIYTTDRTPHCRRPYIQNELRSCNEVQVFVLVWYGGSGGTPLSI